MAPTVAPPLPVHGARAPQWQPLAALGRPQGATARVHPGEPRALERAGGWRLALGDPRGGPGPGGGLTPDGALGAARLARVSAWFPPWPRAAVRVVGCRAAVAVGPPRGPTGVQRAALLLGTPLALGRVVGRNLLDGARRVRGRWRACWGGHAGSALATGGAGRDASCWAWLPVWRWPARCAGRAARQRLPAPSCGGSPLACPW